MTHQTRTLNVEKPSYEPQTEATGLGLLLVFGFLILTFIKFKSARRIERSLCSLELAQAKALDDYRNLHRSLTGSFRDARVVPSDSILVPVTHENVLRYVLPSGYVMRIECKYEHRAVAEEALGRRLLPSEVVHHIYGPARSDNSRGNLCVIDRNQHDDWHHYLRSIRVETGRYPSVPEQRQMIRERYHAIFLS